MTAVEPYPHVLPGPVQEAAPPRRPGSVRRTSHVDVTRGNDGAFLGASAMAGDARDLLTARDGTATVIGEAHLAVTIGTDGNFATVEQWPPTPDCSAIVGARSGFAVRSGIKAVLAAVGGTTLGALVDDLSGAPAPSGYGAIRERVLLGIEEPPRPPGPVTGSTQTDVCAGWRSGGLPTTNRETGVPMPFEASPPVAPALVVDGDDLAWHGIGPLGDRQSRRVRRLDLWREGDRVFVDTMFRDSTADPDLTVRVVHEYEVTVVLDGESFVILEIDATPRSLPFPTDCPFAAGSAQLIVGQPAGDLRMSVRTLSRGPGSCTHLNDLYRSLADVPVLAAHLPV